MKDSSDRTKHFNVVGGMNGLGHTQNPAHIWYDNWCFRSQQEVAYYQALVIRRKIKNGTLFLTSDFTSFISLLFFVFQSFIILVI